MCFKKKKKKKILLLKLSDPRRYLDSSNDLKNVAMFDRDTYSIPIPDTYDLLTRKSGALKKIAERQIPR